MSSLSALLLIPALILTFRPDFIFRRIAVKHNPLPVSVVVLALAFGLINATQKWLGGGTQSGPDHGKEFRRFQGC